MATANKIEETLRQKYKCIINVSNCSGNLLKIKIYIKTGIECEFLVMYFDYMTYDEYIKDLSERIDAKIAEIFHK